MEVRFGFERNEKAGAASPKEGGGVPRARAEEDAEVGRRQASQGGCEHGQVCMQAQTSDLTNRQGATVKTLKGNKRMKAFLFMRFSRVRQDWGNPARR